jgi:hypothetical protein
MKLVDKNGETYIGCPSGFEYLDKLSVLELVSLTPAAREDVDKYLFLLIAVKSKVGSGWLQEKDTYSVEEFLFAHLMHYESIDDESKIKIGKKMGYL